MRSYEDQKYFSDLMTPIGMSICEGLSGLSKVSTAVLASQYEDRTQATDFKIIRTGSAVAFRVRNHDYLTMMNGKYKWSFTLRTHCRGYKTEFEKIMEGWGDYLFYSYANPDWSDFAHWFVVDLAEFRKYWSCVGDRWVKTTPGKRTDRYGSRQRDISYQAYIQPNKDRETMFMAIDIRTWPSNVIAHASDYINYDDDAPRIDDMFQDATYTPEIVTDTSLQAYLRQQK